jgi:hypothetical protein
VNPATLAKFITAVEYDIFRNITVHECLDQIWGDKRKKELNKIEGARFSVSGETMLSKLIKHTNKVFLS